MLTKYNDFLISKRVNTDFRGFEPTWIPDFLFDFQKELVVWSIKKGQAAIFADCGLGKTPMQLVWAQNVVEQTGKSVLIFAPLAVTNQTVREAKKFGIGIHKTRNGKVHKGINITNYERLHYFDQKDIAGIVIDESGIIKNFAGKFRQNITEFTKDIPYRLLCTATPSPNDYMELGTSAELLSNMTRMQMLGMFFTNSGDSTQQWLLKGHAKKRFWEWVATWARAIRKPSDFGYDDGDFVLPKMGIKYHTLETPPIRGYLFNVAARTLQQQRSERNRSINERCEMTADIAIKANDYHLCWCNLNKEGDLLEKLIPGSIQVAGANSDEEKEERLEAFANGEFKVLVTKTKIACFGLNLQHCNAMTFFPSHSHEQFYQALRRCWRFGQKRSVTCNIVMTDRESLIVSNMIRKEKQAVEMYDQIIKEMHEFQTNKRVVKKVLPEMMQLPEWL